MISHCADSLNAGACPPHHRHLPSSLLPTVLDALTLDADIRHHTYVAINPQIRHRRAWSRIFWTRREPQDLVRTGNNALACMRYNDKVLAHRIYCVWFYFEVGVLASHCTAGLAAFLGDEAVPTRADMWRTGRGAEQGRQRPGLIQAHENNLGGGGSLCGRLRNEWRWSPKERRGGVEALLCAQPERNPS